MASNEGCCPPGLASLHNHSRYCDGQGTIKEYVQAAMAAGLVAFGASSHAPLPFPCDYAMPIGQLDRYCAEVRDLAATYRDQLPVYLGLELDYLPGLSSFYQSELLSRGFDYFVASVHYVGEPGTDPWAYDESEECFAREIQQRHRGDARPVVEDYYRRLRLMVEEVSGWECPIIVGHLDRIALWNRDDRYFPTTDDWYLDLVSDALSTVARLGLVVEINTSGWSKPRGAPNPDASILSACQSRAIPITISADAHRPENVAWRFPEATRLLRELGIHGIVTLGPDGWQPRQLSES